MNQAYAVGAPRAILRGVVKCSQYIGNTFSDRVAASLLRASGLEELITTSGVAFVDLGTQLGRDTAKLQQNSRTSPLFDTPLFVRNFERAFKEMSRRSLTGEPHTSFHVSECKP